MRTLPALTLLISSLLTLSGCGGLDLKSADPAPEPVNSPDDGADSDLDDATGATPAPGAARMVRLTQQQYRNAALDLTGWAPSSPLPVDYDLHGYITVGAGEVSVAPFDLELYEAAAWELAEAMVPAESAVDGVLGCALQLDSLDDLLGGDTGGGPDIDETCVRSWTAGLVAEAWRRPAVSSEVDPLVDLFVEIHDLAGPTLATRAVVAATLISPDFLFRVELGAPDEDDPVGHRLTDWELASRMAFFLTDAPPDATLRQAVTDGELATDAGVRAQAERLLDTERAETALTGFFIETLDLGKLNTIEKDPATFPLDSPALRTAMRTELEVLFQEVALQPGVDLRSLLTTNMAWVEPALAEVYGLEDMTAAGWVSLPEDDHRGGLLGRAGFLAINAAASRTSPTFRGKFVRTRLLCQDILPPPEGVVASLEGIDSSGTLRDTLEQHMTDSTCNSCHVLMDPIGFALEDFDGIGAWRIADNGLPIDSTAEVDGVAIEGAEALGALIANHNRFGVCMTTQLFRHATGALEGPAQEPLIADLTAQLGGDGHSFRSLVVNLVSSPGFRGVTGPLSGETCAVPGDTRPCETDCAAGIETCTDDLWQGCTAAPVSPETCDAVDQDCDGIVDVDPIQACETLGLAGVQSCAEGAWSTCDPVALPAETCNGEDDDRDGVIDDNLGLELVAVSVADIQASHASCVPSSTGVSGGCNAATNRFCAARGCGTVTGIGLLARDFSQDQVAVACLDASLAQTRSTTFSELQTHHGACLATNPVSADCNAAISRYCTSQGLVTGYGPLEHAGDAAAVACTPTADIFQITYDELTARQGDCWWPTNRHGDACNQAIHQWCASAGYATGFGPLENWDNNAWVACIPWPEETSP